MLLLQLVGATVALFAYVLPWKHPKIVSVNYTILVDGRYHYISFITFMWGLIYRAKSELTCAVGNNRCCSQLVYEEKNHALAL